MDKARANQHKRAVDIMEQKDRRNLKQEQFKEEQQRETEKLLAQKQQRMHDLEQKRRARDAELMHWK